MELTLVRDVLLGALAVAEKALPNGTMVPVINNILFEATGSRVKLKATNFEFEVVSQFDFDTAGELKALLPPKFAPIIGSLSGHEVVLAFENGGVGVRVGIEDGSSKFKLLTQAADDYPLIGEHEPEGIPLEFSQGEFKELLRQVLFCVSNDSSRPAFNGVLFRFDQAGLTVASSDAYRLAYKTIPGKAWEFAESALLVPGKTLKELARLLSDNSGKTVTIYPRDNQVIFRADSFYFAARVLAEKYPDLSGVLPRSYLTKVVVPVRQLEAIIGRAALIAEGANQAIRLNLTGGDLDIFAESQVGRVTETLPLESKEGDDVELYINARFLSEALKAVPGKAAESASTARPGLSSSMPKAMIH
ncbi:MAG: DNA polymerase III subunit beta, partial [Bacillota bacterium]